MSLPNLQEYNEAIQSPQICFSDSDLRIAVVECNPMGLPRPRSGNFATVYKLEGRTKKWAVKCFNRELRDQHERYAAVNAYLRQVSLPFMVDFTFLATGIRVRGAWYPILKMEWAEGEPLISWIQKNLYNPNALRGFSQSFCSMLAAMRQVSVAHGDLQHGNILVVNGTPKLVDYDGMYVPTLAGKTSNEIGQPNYQVPTRTASDFGPCLDNFSAWVIQISLFALIVDPKLWQTFQGGDDCLLFRKRDFEAPNQSALFRALESERDPELLHALALFRTILGCSPQTIPNIDGTFSMPVPVTTVPTTKPGGSWIYDHLPSSASSSPSSSVLEKEIPKIDWVLDATNSPGPMLRFENPVAIVRFLTHSCILLCAFLVFLSFHGASPLLVFFVPVIAVMNLIVWRAYYRTEPAIAKLQSLQARQNGLRERVRVMETRIEEIESQKQQENRSLADRKAELAKEERGLSQGEQKAKREADAFLQTAISWSLQNKQTLDAQEATELSTLQSGLGRHVSTLAQSISSLAQAEAAEMSNALKTKQTTFVQNKLRQSWIATSPIGGIGVAYKTRLQAAGFYTAADIDYYAVQRVQGIGGTRANALRAWRQGIELNARSQMPQALTQQEELAIRTKYATQRSNLQTQLDQNQKTLRNLESNIRAKFSNLKAPHESLLFAERQKHQLELEKISTEFKYKRDNVSAKFKALEDERPRVLSKYDSQQQEIRRDIFQLQWQMGKVEREMRRFSGISFRAYSRRVLFFAR